MSSYRLLALHGVDDLSDSMYIHGFVMTNGSGYIQGYHTGLHEKSLNYIQEYMLGYAN